MEEYSLDDRYTEGVWYDAMNGDFCKIQASSGSGPDSQSASETVELVNPETDEVYWDMLVQEWVEEEQQDFRPVAEEAVTDPKNYVVEMLDSLDGLECPNTDELISLSYARKQVEIREK